MYYSDCTHEAELKRIESQARRLRLRLRDAEQLRQRVGLPRPVVASAKLTILLSKIRSRLEQIEAAKTQECRDHLCTLQRLKNVTPADELDETFPERA